MSFSIVQTNPLLLSKIDTPDEEPIRTRLKEVGEHVTSKKPQFNEDREERKATFVGNVGDLPITVEVTYSIGVDGHGIEDVEIVGLPNGYDVFEEPSFETR